MVIGVLAFCFFAPTRDVVEEPTIIEETVPVVDVALEELGPVVEAEPVSVTEPEPEPKSEP